MSGIHSYHQERIFDALDLGNWGSLPDFILQFDSLPFLVLYYSSYIVAHRPSSQVNEFLLTEIRDSDTEHSYRILVFYPAAGSCPLTKDGVL